MRGAPHKQVSHRLQAVQAPVIPIVAELIRTNPGTISLGQGVVGYGPPREAIDQLQCFLASPNQHKYQPVQGIPDLLERIGEKLRVENQLETGPANPIVVTAGGNLAFANAVLAIGDPGDEFILQRPFYFNHEMAITLANCQPVLVDTDPAYQLRPDAIAAAITDRTRAVVTISPNNPTGAAYSEESLRAVNELCRTRGLYHIHDEAYEYFTFDGARHFSPGSIEGSRDYTLSLFSLSKAFGFASWRIGYMVIPEHLLVAVKKIQDTLLICPPVISQFAAIGALKAGVSYCREQLKEIAAVRALFLEALANASNLCSVPRTRGAFYFLIRVKTGLESMRCVERLIREFKVAAIPGAAFGLSESCYLRVAYGALDRATAREGIDRLIRGLNAIV